jgi:hypothetical protein
MGVRALAAVGGLASLVAAVLGVVFWQEESDYAASHGNDALAVTLQKAGIGLAAIGVAGIIFAVALYRLGSRD